MKLWYREARWNFTKLKDILIKFLELFTNVFGKNEILDKNIV